MSSRKAPVNAGTLGGPPDKMTRFTTNEWKKMANNTSIKDAYDAARKTYTDRYQDYVTEWATKDRLLRALQKEYMSKLWTERKKYLIELDQKKMALLNFKRKVLSLGMRYERHMKEMNELNAESKKANALKKAMNSKKGQLYKTTYGDLAARQYATLKSEV